eukprot:6261250-Amphidinium_carterae.1
MCVRAPSRKVPGRQKWGILGHSICAWCMIDATVSSWGRLATGNSLGRLGSVCCNILARSRNVGVYGVRA